MSYQVTYDNETKEFKTKKPIAEHYKLTVYIVNKIGSLHNDYTFVDSVRKPHYIPRYINAIEHMKIVYI